MSPVLLQKENAHAGILPDVSEVGKNALLRSIGLLIVDDSPPIIKYLEVLARKLPEVSVFKSAGSIAESQELLNSFIPDLVLLDLSAAENELTEFARTLKQLNPKSRLYLMSGFDLEEYKLLGESRDIDGFFSKTEINRELPELIRRCCADLDNPQP